MIIVREGIYNEDLTISQDVVIIGAGMVVINNIAGHTFNINASNVVLKNLNINTTVMIMSSFFVEPRQGHMDRVKRIYA